MKFILNILVLASFSLSQPPTPANKACEVGNKCISCMQDGCHTCKYKLSMNDRTCGKTLIDDCEIMYERDGGVCTQCKEGFVLAKDKKTCKKTTISKCVMGFIDANNVEKCSQCYDQWPNSGMTSCSDDLEAGNCTIGGSNMFGGRGCLSCVQGYSLNFFGKCSPECTIGCLTCINGFCIACNHYRGFYDIGLGKCMSESAIPYVYILSTIVLITAILV